MCHIKVTVAGDFWPSVCQGSTLYGAQYFIAKTFPIFSLDFQRLHKGGIRSIVTFIIIFSCSLDSQINDRDCSQDNVMKACRRLYSFLMVNKSKNYNNQFQISKTLEECFARK